MSVIENMQSLVLTTEMEKWLNDIRHNKGLYHMMYDKDSIAKFEQQFSLNSNKAKAAVNDWYSTYGD